MAEIRIYGASDDLIEVEGDITQEFNFWSREDDEARYLGFSDGTIIRAVYDCDGCWRFVRMAEGSASFEKTEATGVGDDDETDRVTLTGDIRWVVFGTEMERAESNG